MAVTGKNDLPESQLAVYEQGVIVSGANMSNIDTDGSVTLGGSINGATNEFLIYTKLSPVIVALVDGTEVTPVTMADTKVTITPAEYGNVISTTRLASAATAGRADLGAAKLIGINIVESPNAKGVATLESATTSVAALTPGTLSKLDLRARYTSLRAAGVLPFSDGNYRARIHPEQISDIKDDYNSLVMYTDGGAVLKGGVGALEGFTLIEDRAVTPGTVICYGDNALGKSESVETGPVITDGTDNLGRIRNHGWYGVYEFGIVDQNAVELITGA